MCRVSHYAVKKKRKFSFWLVAFQIVFFFNVMVQMDHEDELEAAIITKALRGRRKGRKRTSGRSETHCVLDAPMSPLAIGYTSKHGAQKIS